MHTKFLYEKISRKKLDALVKKNATTDLVLDIGSGKSPYRTFFPNSVSLDIHPESGADLLADALKLPISDEQFNQVICLELLEHVQDPQKCIDEIYRVLRSNGKLILSTRFIFSIHHAPNDYFRFTKYGLRHLLRNFEIISIEAETTNFETLAVSLQRIVFQSKFRFDAFTSTALLIVAKILSALNCLIVRQFGQRSRKTEESEVIASGYFVVCRKKIT